MIGRLNFYLIRRFALWLMITGAGFGAIAILGDFLEMLRFTNRVNLGAADAFYFTLLRLPLLIIDFLPFVFLFSTVFCLLRMSQAQELAVIRAAGVSVWQFLMPILAFTFILSALIVALLEPLGTSGFKRYTAIKDELTGQKPKFSFSTDAVWFRESSSLGNYIIRAARLDPQSANRLLDVDVLVFTEDGNLAHRLKADAALLEKGVFSIAAARYFHSNDIPVEKTDIDLPTSLQPENLTQSFMPAKSINIWQMPNYIARASQTGIDVARHQVRFQSLLALPLLLMSMVMVAACFSLPTGRMVSTGQTLGMAVLSGFVLFLFNDFIQLLGDLGSVPPFLSAWVAAVIAMLLAISYLLSTEDG